MSKRYEAIKSRLNQQINQDQAVLFLPKSEWFYFLSNYSENILSQYFTYGLWRLKDGRLCYMFRGCPVVCGSEFKVHLNARKPQEI